MFRGGCPEGLTDLHLCKGGIAGNHTKSISCCSRRMVYEKAFYKGVFAGSYLDLF